MNFVEEMKWRGMIHDIMPGTEEQLQKEMTSAYIGFDPTADSLHIGSLVQIMTLVHLQRSGHKPFALVGGATGMVGDPSGKSKERNLLSPDTLEHNLKCVQKQLACFLDFDCGENSAEIVNNYDWFKSIGFLEFIRDVGKHISINYMMAKDSVKTRLETGMSFTEFTYQLVQGYDFYWLWKNKNCKVQLGGSDQWGNIVTGIDLVRKASSKQAFGLTSPLLTTSSGSKMGKTANGAIWLNNDQLSDWDFWQYWRNTEDLDVIKFLKLFTELPISEIRKLEKLKGAEINEAKIILANEVTKLCRSSEAADKIASSSAKLFSNSETDDTLPSVEVTNSEISFIDALKILNFLKSNGEARRLIRGNGAKINDVVINDENYTLSDKDYKNGKVKISYGKKKHGLLILS